MATYTLNTGIKKITTGDESGTWGDSNNTNWDIIDAALGYDTYDFLSDANVTLTIGEFDTGDPAGALVLVITDTGMFLTADRDVTLAPSDCQKLWFVRNQTAYDLTFKQGSAGSSVTVLTGEDAIIYADGGGATNGNIYDAIGNLSITSINAGTVTVTSTFTSVGIDDNATGERLQIADSTMTLGPASGAYNLDGGDATQYITFGAASGAEIVLYGGSHATIANDINIRDGSAVTKLYFDHSTSTWGFQAMKLTGTGSITFTGGGSLTGTWTDMGSVTTIDINGGTADNMVIGGTTPAAGTFTTLVGTGGTLDSNVIGGTTPAAGTFTTLTTTGAFTSLGIDDNATGERMQIADGSLTLGAASTAYTVVNAATDQTMRISGGSSGTLGANYAMFGESEATGANDHLWRQGTTNILRYDHSNTHWNFFAYTVTAVGDFDCANGNVKAVESGTSFVLQNSADENVLVGTPNAEATLYYNDVTELATAQHDANYTLSGATLKDHSGTVRAVGFANSPFINVAASVTLNELHATSSLHKTSGGTGVQITLPAATSGAVFPVDSTVPFYNRDTEDVDILQDTGVTLYHFTGSGAPQTGNRVVSQGGAVQISRVSATIYYITGSGIS